MNKFIFILVVLNVSFFLIVFYLYLGNKEVKIDDNSIVIAQKTPLNKYAVEELSSLTILNSDIKILETEESDSYSSHIFSFEFNPDPESKTKKTTTGLINVPKHGESESIVKYPLVLMIRGYVDPTIYETGIGTRNAGFYFAENGFITIAPDFLGYAGSDINSSDIFESRFQTYTTVLSLINKFYDPQFASILNNMWDGENIFIWAHSNGGQIALTVLAAKSYNFPTSLWAPVTKPFPYSILYYTDESEDRGKLIRSNLANFEELYDVDHFSFTNYLSKLSTPLIIHQGANDNAVPKAWNDDFVATLKKLDKDVNYFTYPNANHNMQPDWNSVVEKDMEFFAQHKIAPIDKVTNN